VGSGLLATPEGRAAVGARDDAGFVTWAYERLLGRTPDAAGHRWWVDVVARLGRGGALAALASTSEAVARLGNHAVVLQVYDALLHRLPSPAEVSGWGAIGRGALAAAVVGSDEYR
jgi:hypothetical protein